MSEFKIGCSPLTGEIFAGTVSKTGLWAKNKHNVTNTAVGAVAEHLLHVDQSVVFNYRDKKYRLQVVEVKEEA